MSAIAHKKASLEVDGSKLEIKIRPEVGETSNANAPTKKIGLRGSQLYGSILIGNYDYLKELEVCENEMAILDLSSLQHLENLTCNRNKLKELIVNGNKITTIAAKYNNLHIMTVSPVPQQLTDLDLSHNNFAELPSWISSCSNLRIINADHNRICSLTEFHSNNKITALRSLNISWNNIRYLSNLPENFRSLQYLYLQCNELQQLPSNLFSTTNESMKVFNAACNKLVSLPAPPPKVWCLEELFLSSNKLDERIFEVLLKARELRVLYVAYNQIQELPERCVEAWTKLVVLVLSGNVLQSLPSNIGKLPKLEELRLHSNLLLSSPVLAELSSLKVLDLAHNHLDRVNLLNIIPLNLKHLDLSCNLQLQVDEKQVEVCRSKKKWSLVDVSGRDRVNLPTAKHTTHSKEINALTQPWTMGFSETVGKCRKMMACQLRACNFQADEGLFGMFESEETHTQASLLASLIPQALQHERGVKESINEYLKYTLLNAYQRVANDAAVACRGLASTVCHIARESRTFKDYVRPQKTKKYILRVASVGNIGAYLVRRTSNVCLVGTSVTIESESRLKVFPDPITAEVALGNKDEYLVICNSNVWAVMDIDRVTREIRKEENTVLAAKRLQDIAQSFGSNGNISVIVVRFHSIGTDVDHLIRELKQTVRKKPITKTVVANGQITSYYDHNASCRLNFAEKSSLCPQLLGGSVRSDRSSPSGQSDQVLNLLGKDIETDNYILSHATVLEEEDEMEILDETDSALSEEQFKCWEYMLEQNTQLLFDKELNTISKSFTKNRYIEPRDFDHAPDKCDNKSNKLVKSFNNKFISTSSPHLLYSENVKKSSTPAVVTYHQQQEKQTPPDKHPKQFQVSFLSKHFGSNRSFQASPGYSLFESKSRSSSMNIGPYSKICGGPNAAYFGSLQRLIPYNLEYDFTLTQDRTILQDDDEEEDDDDIIDHDNRIRKYWGVATTEL